MNNEHRNPGNNGETNAENWKKKYIKCFLP